MADTVHKRPTDYPKTPEGWASRWAEEIEGARRVVKRWQSSASEVVDRFLDERHDADDMRGKRVNLFTANVQTVSGIIYGRTPKVTVTRRFADATDDVGRVAGEILERLLNADLEADGDTCAEALGYALQDRLLGGLGQVRVRFEMEGSDDELLENEEGSHDAVSETQGGPESTALAPDVDSEERDALLLPPIPPPAAVAPPGIPDAQALVDEHGDVGTRECVAVDYVHWRDFLWSPARTWSEVRWVAFRSELTPDDVERKWGKETADRIPYAVSNNPRGEDEDKDAPNPWARAEVWEIWDKSTKSVYWWVEGYARILGEPQKDPLQLRAFFPCPQPLIANLTTKRFLPRPDFALAQDQYDEVDSLTFRIQLLTNAVRAAGVYGSDMAGVLETLLDNTSFNKMFPIAGWALFAEKGGIKGVTDWLPLDQFVNAISVLSQQKEAAKAELYEVTGMSDIMRGQAGAAGVTATEQQIKAQYGSTRIQALQDSFARFASNVQELKKEVVARFYDDATIREQSNADFTEDAKQPGLIDAAIRLIRDKHSSYRVVVKPEAVSMTDFAQLKQERQEVIGSVSQFITAAQPLVQSMPGSMPFLLEMLQWTFAGIKGGAEVEGVLDRAIQQFQQMQQQAAQQPPQQPPPDPKLQELQLKGQLDQQREQQKADLEARNLQVAVNADNQRENNQREQNVREALEKQQIQAAFKPLQEQSGHPYGRMP